MNLKSIHQRLVAGSLLATLAVAGLAPAADAGRGGYTQKVRRVHARSHGGHWRGAPSRTVVVHRSSGGGGSTLAGFIGGLAVGAILGTAASSHANSHPRYESRDVYAPPPPDYRGSRGGYDDRGDYGYEDPYCHERFSSLGQYDAHCDRNDGHPRYVEVIDSRNGACVGSMRHDGGNWSKCDRDEWRNGGGPWNDDRDGRWDDDEVYDDGR